jgi:ATP-dependent helicase/nuclease subunit B
VSDAELQELTDFYVERYVHEELNDFQEKSSRFVYLFKRLRENVGRVVRDMAEELRASDFVPLDFELDFSSAGDIPPIELGADAEALSLSGVADRVDGWLHDGKLYLRVVDYKTGKKEFSLSEVLNGMNLQMLLYLFTLSDAGQARYGRELVPAGVMYIPARSPMLSSDTRMDAEAVTAERAKELRRSGLVLDSEAVREAWEHGSEKRYIPLKFRYGKPTADTLASAERLGLLDRHIRRQLRDMAKQLRAGSIAADPFYRSQADNACLRCDYADACGFVEGRGGEKSRYLAKYSPEEVWALMEEGEGHV